jgi:thiamine biosynthesis lipoprotein
MRTATTVLALIVAAHAFAATRARYLMGTVCEVSAGDERQIESAFGEASRVESMLSTWRADSEFARINEGRPTHVSPELMQLVYDLLEYEQYTGDAFHPLTGTLIEAWQIRGRGAQPDAATLERALAPLKQASVEICGSDCLRLLNGAKLEEGAFGKGYALDRMLPLVKGDVVLNFGGQLLVRGTHEVTIADPRKRDQPLVALALTDASLSTSAGSEKTFIVNGRSVTHIVDPRTGQALPPRGSVSVVSRSAFLADIYSTALYVMGVDDGLRWCNAHDVAALFISRDGVARASRTFPKFKVKD